tara:strand:- start:3341 stop:4096 length:756 start_codon:yes stop_codon:yes gene_type:complete
MKKKYHFHHLFYFIRLLLLSIFLTACGHSDWRTADRSSAGIAPLPQKEKRAIVQVYVARTFNWHKYLAVHSWIAFKEHGAEAYEVYHVVGWQVRNGGSAIRGGEDIPDRKWYGSMPVIINELVGEKAERAIPKIREVIQDYPYQKFYRMFPGPNSNTFVSHIIRSVDDLQVELPPNAVGKDWIGEGDLFAYSESGTGVQASIFGLLGLTLGLAEGIEVNLLGLSFGLDILRPAIKLPGIGRLGMKDAAVPF